ncbi:MAG TPA: PhzF family phenazine biosynthesis protein [Solirubrobacteraceae bacterium]|nr:PhzF family phenazine biosynthesis protein [Solirubrobacteraceae bacterium]
MHRYEVLDVFTDAPLQGNPVAVFTDAADLSAEGMQRTAREMNLSESVFIVEEPSDERGYDAHIRIFTPAIELPFAGHPVLGTAYVVGAAKHLALVRLKTAAGVIPIELSRERNRIVYGEMEQPIPAVEPFEWAEELLAAVGVQRAELPVLGYRNGPLHVYVALSGEEAVAALEPDLAALRKLGEIGVSCFAGEGGRFKTRMFAPGLGVSEDPATGSAAGPLAVHLARHGWSEYGRPIQIRQGEEIGRPSVLHARVDGSDERIERVVVGGAAVVVAHGEYRLD